MACIKPRKLWLDALPSEVHLRIASYLVPEPFDRDSYYPFLHLAETSESLRLIIVTALCFSLKITRRLEHIDRWANVFCPNLRELEICVHRKRKHKPTLQLLKAPRLERLTLIARPDLLNAIHHAPSLRTLSVTIFNDLDIAALFDSLRTLSKLTSLKIQLRGRCVQDPGCSFSRAGRSASELAECCKGVTSLDIRCTCYNTERCIAWRWAFVLPAIRVLTFYQNTSAWFLDFDYEDADICNTILLCPRRHRPIEGLAVAFGVDGVTYTAKFADADSRPVREALALTLNTGAKLFFPGTTSTLESFRLEWPSDQWLGEYLYPVMHHEHELGSLLHSIQEMSALSCLQLMEVRIEVHELASILEHLGPRLKVFGTAIEGQAEEPDERFKTVMEIVSRHNPALHKLCLDFCLVNRYRQHSEVHSSETLHRKDELHAAYQALMWRCPHVQIYDEHSQCVRSYGDMEEIIFGDGCDDVH